MLHKLSQSFSTTDRRSTAGPKLSVKASEVRKPSSIDSKSSTKQVGHSSHVSSFDWKGQNNSEVNSQLSLKESHDVVSTSTEEDAHSRSLPGFDFINKFPDDPGFENRVHQAEIAIAEGVLPELIKAGSSGSYFVRNKNGNMIAVFKPRDEEPYGPANPKWGKFWQRHCCPCCFGRSCLLLNHGYVSEAGASLIDEKLGFHIVPQTKVVMLTSPSFNYPKRSAGLKKISIFKGKGNPPKIGSFQLFVEGYKDASTWLQNFNKKPLPPESEKEFCVEFQKLTILDYLIRNTDRGHDNWLVRCDDNAAGSVDVNLAAIDNGLAFPHKHPDEWRKYPFYWAQLPRARQPYAQEVKETVLPMLEDEDFIAEMIESLFLLFRIDKNFQLAMFEKQMSVMRGQLSNMKEALKNGYSPAEMAVMDPIMIETKVNAHGELSQKYRSASATRRPFFTSC